MKQLDIDKPDRFHHIISKLLYVLKRARPDIQPVVDFLSTRMAEPDKSDWSKFIKLVVFLVGMIKDVLTLGVDDAQKLF